MGENRGFPFTAVVGMEDAKRALECAVVSPRIRSILIRGISGSAKTVLARSIAGIAGRTVVNCPLNITDEQLYGGIDMEKAVQTGEVVLEPGLLARADGGILYIDDVNLMDRGMLSCVLDAALTGRFSVERGPISAVCESDFTLVATMNPEDTDLSSHMLDRFALCAYADNADDAGRREIVRRNMQFSEDPSGFLARFKEEEDAETLKVSRAVDILPLVTISDQLVEVVSELCVRVGADGLRADISMIECAKSLAALNGRDEVNKKDVEEAAALCLPHRRNYDQPPPEPPEPPEEPPEDEEPPEEPPEDQDPPEPPEEPPEQDEDEPPEEPPENPQDLPDVEEMLFEIGRQFRVIDYVDAGERIPSRTKTRKGRRAMAVSADGTGRYARSKLPQGKVSDVAFDATVRAAAPYQKFREKGRLAIAIEKKDLREKVRERRSGTTIVFLVDAYGSLGVRKRMATVKGAIMSMLRESHVKRDRIGLMAFRRTGTEVILPPTRSVEYSYKCLEELPTGGKTPLGNALNFASDYMTSYIRSHTGERCFIVLITDGRANVPLEDGSDANDEVQSLAERIHVPGLKWIVVDASSGFIRFDNAQKLAVALEGRYFRLEDLDADRFADGVRAAVDG